jgi:hypothetical protein
MKSIQNIKDGDIFLVANNKPISHGIMAFMWLWAIQKRQPTIFVPSHAGTLYWENGELVIYESLKNGNEKRIFLKSYDLEKITWFILTPNMPYTSQEQIKMKMYAEELLFNKHYQYGSFLSWIICVATLGIVQTWRDSDKLTVCFEYAARLAASQRPSDWPKKLENVTGIDILENTNWRVLYL